MANILLVDDEPSIRLTVGDALRDAGHRVDLAADGAQGLAAALSGGFDLVITDVRLPKMDGLTLFRRLRAESPDTDVILITAYGDVTDAVSALKEGALDYLTKPMDIDELIVRVARVGERQALKRALSDARQELAKKSGAQAIVGKSPPIVRLLDRIEMVAGSEAPVLILGESGTGKELVARRVHQLSARSEKPFVAVNCAAFPETLLEAELFGHERGAFTGAVKRREGRFKVASGGTLFLDEIAEIPPAAQAKLLRVLQEGTIEPLGSDKPVAVDVRIIAATHQNLKARIATKAFREDLFYRLNVLDLSLPPLRERRSDLALLVEHFLGELTPPGRPRPSISPRAWAALSEYPFPGNVRELRHAIERATVLSRGAEIDLDHLPDDIRGAVSTAPEAVRTPGPEVGFRPLSVVLGEFEREYLMRALHAAEGKKGRAAELLGISRKNLWEKLRHHELSDAHDSDA